MRLNALVAAVFVIALVLERGDADKDAVFWSMVAAGVVGVVVLASARRSKGGIGATGN